MNARRVLDVVVVACTLLGVVVHAWWLAADDTALFWDMGRHAVNARWAHTIMFSPLGAWDTARLLYLGPEDYYPPLFYVVAAVTQRWTAPDADGMAWASFVFVPVLAWSCARVAWRGAGPAAGVMAACMCMGAPMLFDFSHQVMLDLPLTAMVALFLAVLVERPFHAWHRALLLGLVGGMGTLVKWTYPVFILPAAVMTTWGFRPRWNPRARLVRTKFFNGAIATALGVALALPWFQEHRKALFGTREASTHVPGIDGLGPLAVVERLVSHVRFLWEYQLDAFGSLLALVAVGYALRLRGRPSRAVRACMLTIGCSVLAWGVMGKHQDARYSMPQLAALIPLVAIFVHRVKWRLLTMAAWCWPAWALCNVAFAPAIFAPLTSSRIAAQRGYHAGPPAEDPPAAPLQHAVDIIRSRGIREVSFTRDLDVAGADEWSLRAYLRLADMVLVEGEPGATVHTTREAPPRGPAWRVGDAWISIEFLRIGPSDCRALAAHGWSAFDATGTGEVRIRRGALVRERLDVANHAFLAHVHEGEALEACGSLAVIPRTATDERAWALRLPAVGSAASRPGPRHALRWGPYLDLDAGDVTMRARVVGGPTPTSATLSTPGHPVADLSAPEVVIKGALPRAWHGVEVSLHETRSADQPAVTVVGTWMLGEDLRTLERVRALNPWMPGTALLEWRNSEDAQRPAGDQPK